MSDEAILIWIKFALANAIYLAIAIGVAALLNLLEVVDISALRLGTAIWLIKMYWAFRVEFRQSKED